MWGHGILIHGIIKREPGIMTDVICKEATELLTCHRWAIQRIFRTARENLENCLKQNRERGQPGRLSWAEHRLPAWTHDLTSSCLFSPFPNTLFSKLRLVFGIRLWFFQVYLNACIVRLWWALAYWGLPEWMIQSRESMQKARGIYCSNMLGCPAHGERTTTHSLSGEPLYSSQSSSH